MKSLHRVWAVTGIAIMAFASGAAAQDLSVAKQADRSSDYKTAWPLYLAAAEAGNTDAMLKVANYLTTGKHGPKNPSEALMWLERMIEQGDARGAHAIGEMYYYGDGVRSDPAKSRDWACRGAELGSEDAAQRCAQLAEKGEGGPKDFALASKWYAFAADRGLGLSQGGVSRLKKNGTFVAPAPPVQVVTAPNTKPSPSEPMASARSPIAAAPAMTLGETGASYPGSSDFSTAEALWAEGKTTDAYPYFIRAAQSGNPAAMFRVGDYHATKTHGDAYDPMQAAAAFRAALDAGYAPAQERLTYAEETLRLRAKAFRDNSNDALRGLYDRDTQEMVLTMSLSDSFPDQNYGQYMAAKSLWNGRHGAIKDHNAALILMLNAGFNGYDRALLDAGKILTDSGSPAYNRAYALDVWFACAENDNVDCIKALTGELHGQRRLIEAMAWAIRYRELTGTKIYLEDVIQRDIDRNAERRAEWERKNAKGWREQRRESLAATRQIAGDITYGRSDFWNFGERNAAIYGGNSSGGSATQSFNDTQGRINDWMQNPERYYGLAKPF